VPTGMTALNVQRQVIGVLPYHNYAPQLTIMRSLKSSVFGGHGRRLPSTAAMTAAMADSALHAAQELVTPATLAICQPPGNFAGL